MGTEKRPEKKIGSLDREIQEALYELADALEELERQPEATELAANQQREHGLGWWLR